MKMTKKVMFVLGLVLSAFVFNACQDDDGYSLDKAWYSIATVHPLDDSHTYWLTLDSGTSLWPVATNIPWYDPKETKRAYVVYTLLSDKFSGYDHAVKILDLKSILTKPLAENLNDENDETYGTDPVTITDIWIGGGYLNIIFEFNYGGNAVHYINLIKNESVNTPYFFEFRHNAFDDNERYSRKGIVAFDLSSIDTNGEVELTIQVNTFDGKKLYKVKYDSSTNKTDQVRNYTLEGFTETR